MAKGEALKAHLEALRNAIPELKGVLLASNEGLPIAHSLSNGADPNRVADMCEAVLDVAATADDLARYLNASLLISVWPVLGLNRAKRDAWENRFPVLRRQRLAAAA